MDNVRCQNCGQMVPKKSACGVGRSSSTLVWTCTDCIKQGAMDRVFAPIGKTIRDAVKKVQP